MTRRRFGSGSLGLGLILAACSTSPLGRKQLMLLPDSQMNQMGIQAFDQMKGQVPVENDPAMNAYVRCVAIPITEAAKGKTPIDRWEIVVFKDPTANAFALPGGKIGVHTGILPVAKTDAQLAAVLGHEVGHVIARHGNERMSEGVIEQVGMTAVDAFTQGQQSNGLIMAALGLGTQVGVALPHSRTQESEADLIGLQLMSEAGFDPNQAVDLWKNMIQASGGNSTPEFLSDHPASQNRVASIQEHLPDVANSFKQARAAGKNPVCHRPRT